MIRLTIKNNIRLFLKNNIYSRNFYSNSYDNLIKVNVTDNNGNYFEVKGDYNDTLYDIIKKNKTNESQLLKDCLECSCEGKMECESCHIHIQDDWLGTIEKPSEKEEDMLEMINNRQYNSKLGCQLRLRKYNNGIKISIANENSLTKYLK